MLHFGSRSVLSSSWVVVVVDCSIVVFYSHYLFSFVGLSPPFFVVVFISLLHCFILRMFLADFDDAGYCLDDVVE